MKTAEATRVMLINPPHTPIGSRIPNLQLPPLGMLNVGKFLEKTGFDVMLLDAEYGHMSLFDIVRACRKWAPQYVILGKSGATSAHATVVLLCAMLKFFMPNLVIRYLSVYPPYRYEQALYEGTLIDIGKFDEVEHA
ncbi:hypothetical protein [Undibacterium sp. Di24W]|uniref:hypothetical protein n=1 Tax=Undibacterium sp. Di24W TaxID=3413033 RepID=UPI003BF00BEA